MIKVLIAVVVAGLGGLLIITMVGRGSEPTEVPSTQNVEMNTTDVPAKPVIVACDALSKEVAQSVLGAGARQLNTSSEEEMTGDVAVTDCVYDEGTDSLTGKTVSLVSRRALTSDGYELNKSEMETTASQGLVEGEAATTKTIFGLGDTAVWNEDFGQLNVLLSDGAYWLTVQIGVGGVDADETATVELATMVVESYE